MSTRTAKARRRIQAQISGSSHVVWSIRVHVALKGETASTTRNRPDPRAAPFASG